MHCLFRNHVAQKQNKYVLKRKKNEYIICGMIRRQVALELTHYLELESAFLETLIEVISKKPQNQKNKTTHICELWCTASNKLETLNTKTLSSRVKIFCCLGFSVPLL